MNKKTITICGKEVTLAYNFATEIAFFDLTGQDFTLFFLSILDSMKDKDVTEANIGVAILSVSPTLRIMAVLSAIMSYYQSIDEDAPVTGHDLMHNASHAELQSALSAVFELRNEWYRMPATEAEKAPKSGRKGKGKEKN